MNEREMSRVEIADRINEINNILSEGVSETKEVELKSEREDLYYKLFNAKEKKEEIEYENPLEAEYEITDANDDYLYDYFDVELDEAERIVDEIENKTTELNKYFSGELTSNFGVEPSQIQRQINELEERLNIIKSGLMPSELANLEEYINSKKQFKDNSLLEEAERIVDEIENKTTELNKYFSGELTSNFGVEPSQIQRQIKELEERLNIIKSGLTSSQIAELEEYINSKKKTETIEINPEEKKNDEILALPPGRDKPLTSPEQPKNNEQQALPPGKKVVSKKQWIKDHKKTLITIGIVALSAAIVINLMPLMMSANAALWFHAGANTQNVLHGANMFMGKIFQLLPGVASHGFTPAGLHFFGATELAKYVAPTLVAAAIETAGLVSLKKMLKPASQQCKDYKKQIKNMKKYFKNEVIKKSDLTEEEKIKTVEQLINDLNDRSEKINDNNEMTSKEKITLNKEIQKFKTQLEDKKEELIDDIEFYEQDRFQTNKEEKASLTHNKIDKWKKIKDEVAENVKQMQDENKRLEGQKSSLQNLYDAFNANNNTNLSINDIYNTSGRGR